MNERKITQQKRGSAKKWKRDIQRNWSMREKKKTNSYIFNVCTTHNQKFGRCKNVWFHSGYIPNLDRHIGSGTYEFFSTRGKYLNFLFPLCFDTRQCIIYIPMCKIEIEIEKSLFKQIVQKITRGLINLIHMIFFFFSFSVFVFSTWKMKLLIDFVHNGWNVHIYRNNHQTWYMRFILWIKKKIEWMTAPGSFEIENREVSPKKANIFGNSWKYEIEFV